MYFNRIGGERELSKEKVQPHCMVCHNPFKKDDLVCTDKMFNQIQHEDCFIYHEDLIKDAGTYEEIVNMYPQYKEAFIVSEKPVGNPLLTEVLKRNYH